ncbi:hypothetical protein GIB67_011750 [Kingdonia uniflora]|uniref:Uncharacterized protein n=1 Tax=Kingdonia uniflora TaxID=39325 RepID=A0A7J7LUP8_9MAGN|nr:hypothetical protein GIB67_011750 [Kingdonia uniflora]
MSHSAERPKKREKLKIGRASIFVHIAGSNGAQDDVEQRFSEVQPKLEAVECDSLKEANNRLEANIQTKFAYTIPKESAGVRELECYQYEVDGSSYKMRTTALTSKLGCNIIGERVGDQDWK